MQRITCIAGWVAAAAAVAWWALSSGGKASEREAALPSPPLSVSVAKRPPPAAPKAEKAAAERRKLVDRGRASDTEARSWSPQDKWNVPALYGILGNVPPDVRALADRIRDAHKKAFDGNDLKSTFDCVADARACPNPIVRAMMVDALRLCAMRAARHKDDDDDEDSAGGRKNSGRDGDCLAAFEAAKGFASDPNKFVARNAVNTMYCGLLGVEDSDRRWSAFEEAMSATDGMICGEIKESIYHPATLYRQRDDGGADRSAFLLALSRSIENLGDCEGRRLAEALYRKETGEAFAGLASAERLVSWKGELKDVGTQLFGTEKKGDEFAEIVEDATKDDKDKYEGKDEDLLAASQRYSTPIAALSHVELTDRLKKAAKDLYGDTEKAQKWFEEEMSFYEKYLSELDEYMEERATEMMGDDKGKEAK